MTFDDDFRTDIVTAELEVTEEALTWPEKAKSIKITSAETYVSAAELLKGIKDLQGKINDTFDPHIKRAHESHKGLLAEKKKASEPLEQAESIIKRGLSAWDQEQRRLAALEEQRLREIARQQEEDRRLAEAVALEAEAKKTGDVTLLAEATELLEEPLPPPPVIAVAKATPKVSGLSHSYKPWRAVVTDFMKLVKHVATHPADINLLLPNQVALNKLAGAREGRMNIDGVTASREPNVGVRR